MWSIECLVNTVNISNECKHDLFVEDDPGSKLQKAKELGIKTISGKDLLKMLGQGE